MKSASKSIKMHCFYRKEGPRRERRLSAGPFQAYLPLSCRSSHLQTTQPITFAITDTKKSIKISTVSTPSLLPQFG